MIEYATAVEFQRKMKAGRTDPLLMLVETDSGDMVEAVVKFPTLCDQQHRSLIREAIGVCLANGLGLPVPHPFIVRIDADILDLLPVGYLRQDVPSSFLAFGSKFVPGGALWNQSNRLTVDNMQSALDIFCFDRIICNYDRRDQRPNCFVKGNEFILFDHEMAWPDTAGILGYKEPWELEGFSDFMLPGRHIFAQHLRRGTLDFNATAVRWRAINDMRIAQMCSVIPQMWYDPIVENIASRIAEARDKIDDCMVEAQRVLS